MKITPILLATIALLTATGANAALQSRLGGQAVYDSDLNVTWLADANLALSNTFGVSIYNSFELRGYISPYGEMTLGTAQMWIGAMNSSNYLGFQDWRLPSADATCTAGLNCNGGEIGHLFYTELGGSAGVSINNTHNASYALFKNIQSYPPYWSGTEYMGDPSQVWMFDFTGGFQGPIPAWAHGTTWAVRTGDVAAVPTPAAAWLLGSGLPGLISVARRKAA